MDELEKQEIANRAADKVEADDASNSLIVTLVVILILCGGGYWLYKNFSKTHDLSAVSSSLNHVEAVENRQQ